MENFIESSYKTMIYSETTEKYKGSLAVSKLSISRITNSYLMYISTYIMFLNVFIQGKKNDEDKTIAKIVIIGVQNYDVILKICQMYPFFNFDIYDDSEPTASFISFIKEKNNKDNISYFNHFPSIEDLKEKYYSDTIPLYSIIDFTNKEIKEDIFFSPNENDKKMQYQLYKEELLLQDSRKIMEYVKALEPLKSLVKFRPPHNYKDKKTNNFEFFDGTVILPIFSDVKTSSSHIIVSKIDDTVNWDIEKYNETCNVWNYSTREKFGKNPFDGSNAPLQNQIGNSVEFCILFSILKDYFITISNGYDIDEDIVFSFYKNFISQNRTVVENGCK